MSMAPRLGALPGAMAQQAGMGAELAMATGEAKMVLGAGKALADLMGPAKKP